jgi:hydroxymethylbilane synthase
MYFLALARYTIENGRTTMRKNHLIIATRESPLALWQANWVKECLVKAHPQLTVSLLGLTTQADKMPYISLAEIGGKGLFVKELEEALLDGRADIAVHSMKDMPVELPVGLSLPVICVREEAGDAFVSAQYASLAALPAQAVVGTSSLRRQSQLLAARPDLQVEKLRGNVNTRLARLDNHEYAAIILAAAGLKRLGLQDRIRHLLDREQFLPSAGQGALGIECRQADLATRGFIAVLNHTQTQICVTAERAMLRRLGVGCQVPVAAHAELEQDKLVVHGFVATIDGKRVLTAMRAGNAAQADALGMEILAALAGG